MRRTALPSLAVLGAASLLLSACGEKEEQQQQGGPPQNPEVGVVTLRAESVPVRSELAGRTSPYATSEVRPQVTGIVLRRPFAEGAIVRAGQTLYQIDPAPYRAQLAQAQGQLAAAEATTNANRLRAQRFGDLVKVQAVSKQEADDASATLNQGLASVSQARAAVQSARINLGYTRVQAPISGRVGRSLVTQGALVTANQTEALAVIQRLDPIYVDVTQSSAELLKLRAQLSSGGVMPTRAPVGLTLPDGSTYGLRGVLQFSEPTVDQATGSVTLRAVFPNPQGVLLPGMYVRAQLTEAVDPNAILAPQQGVTRDARGNPQALVLGANNKAELRNIQTTQTYQDKWIVTGGLRPGDRLITEGLANVKPGMTVRPVPAGSRPQRPQGQGQGQGGQGGAQGSGGQGGGQNQSGPAGGKGE